MKRFNLEIIWNCIMILDNRTGNIHESFDHNEMNEALATLRRLNNTHTYTVGYTNSFNGISDTMEVSSPSRKKALIKVRELLEDRNLRAVNLHTR